MMENITEEERRILYECIELGKTDGLAEYCSKPGFIPNTIRRIYEKKGIRFSKQDIEDRQHDLFIHLIDRKCRRLMQYKEELGRFKGWIIQVTNRMVLNKIREKNLDSLSEKRNQISIEDAEKIGLVKSKNKFGTREDLLTLKDAIEKLPPGRELLDFKLRYEKGWSISEIADYTHRSENAVSVSIHRAIQQLKKIISED